MLRLGWQVYRAHVTDVVSVTRARRAVLIAAIAALVAAAAMAALDLAFLWAGPGTARAATAITLLSLGVGLVAFGCCPLARPVEPAATINGRQVRPDTARTVRASVQQYLDRRMPEIRPEHREAVLTDTLLYRRGLIRDATRGTPPLVGGLLAGLAAVLLGASGVVPLWPVIYVGYAVTTLQRLGRAERARRAAESTRPVVTA